MGRGSASGWRPTTDPPHPCKGGRSLCANLCRRRPANFGFLFEKQSEDGYSIRTVQSIVTPILAPRAKETRLSAPTPAFHRDNPARFRARAHRPTTEVFATPGPFDHADLCRDEPAGRPSATITSEPCVLGGSAANCFRETPFGSSGLRRNSQSFQKFLRRICHTIIGARTDRVAP
jgi:hypothetical protein